MPERGFDGPWNTTPRADHLEQEQRDGEAADEIFTVVGRMDNAIRDFTVTGFQDAERLRNDLHLEARLSGKNELETKEYFIKMLRMTINDELRPIKGSEPKIAVLEEVIEELESELLVAKGHAGMPSEDLAQAA